ncbi:DegT/DnrJ/EryC1/StrS family aminotransferase [Leifsonia williamsii]
MSSPDVGALEEEFLLGALRSGWIAPLGPDVDAFEREIADRTGVAHAVALSSGTAALHLALLAAGAGPRTSVITSTMTFAATANSIVYTGATPIFVDCDPESGNMSPELLERALSDAAAQGVTVAAVLPVDLLGRVAAYERIEPIAARYGVPVVSDAAEALGAFRDGRAAGSFGMAAALSFNGNKIMTTSGGGMLLTADGEVAKRARYLATQARQPVAHYEHVDIGYNYRMSNLLAALGRAQLARLDGMIARRRAIRERYRELFAPVAGVEIFQGEGDAQDNCWLTSILVDPRVTGWRATELSAWLAEDDIESRPLWKPMHLQPVFAGATAVVDGSAERLFDTGVTLPSGSVLGEDELGRVTDRIAAFLEARP